MIFNEKLLFLYLCIVVGLIIFFAFSCDEKRRAQLELFLQECAEYSSVYDCEMRFDHDLPIPKHKIFIEDPKTRGGGPT